MVARLRPPSQGLGRGRRFLLPPGTTELRRPRTGPLPQPGRTKDSSGHLPNPVPGPSAPRNNRVPRGMLSGNREERGDRAPPSRARAEGRGEAFGPGGRGPLERLRTWERPGPGRPLGAGGDLALGPWRRGRPGLAQRRRLQEARGFGLRRRRVPRPLSRPSSARETAALRPAPSAAQAQAPAPAPTSTWGPIETVRHAPPPPPAGATAAALGRGRRERRRSPALAAELTGASWRRAAGPCSAPPRFGGADGSLSTRQSRRTGAPGPHGYPPLSDSPPKPSSPAFGASGAKAGHSGPPRPGGPVRGGPAAAVLQAAGRGAARPLDSPARLGPGEGRARGEGMSVPGAGSLTPGGPGLHEVLWREVTDG